MVAAQVIGHDAAIAIAALKHTLSSTWTMPVMTTCWRVSRSSAIACTALADRCVHGITANRERCRAYAERSAAVVTALARVIGY